MREPSRLDYLSRSVVSARTSVKRSVGPSALMAPASAWKFEFTAAALIGAARHERVALAVLLSGLGGRTLSADAQSAIEANKAV